MPVEEPPKVPEPKQEQNLLEIDGSPQEPGHQPHPPQQENSLIDLGGGSEPAKFSTSVPSSSPSMVGAESAYATTIQNNPSDQGSNFFFGEAEKSYKNIVIPYVVVISEAETSREGKYSGLNVQAAFQR